MYRAVTLFALREHLFAEGKPDITALVKKLDRISISFSADRVTGKNNIYLGDENVEEEIRKPEIAGFVSPVSAIREVRAAMVRIQREMGKNKGIVMDGRDIGTVVFPDAELKIFMTADPEIRAQRRFLELTGKGLPVSLEEIRQNIAYRDQMDQSRSESPLRKAADAIVLDNSFLSPEEQLEWALGKVHTLIGKNENRN
jgi:cytidylate kinase